MAWTAGAGSYVELVISADDSTDGTAYAVTCRVPDTGGFTIPGSMTGWIPVPNDGVTAVFARNTVAHLEYPAEGVVIEAVLQTNWTTPLP